MTETKTLNDLGSNDGLGLKPCPFCGSSNVSGGEVSGENRDGTAFKQTGCLDCGALGPMVTPEDVYDEQGCNDAWNKRA